MISDYPLCVPLVACPPVGIAYAVWMTHRKQVKHFNEPGDAHLLTFSCYRREALLLKFGWPALFSESVDRALLKHSFGLTAFVYMPEHVHLLVFPRVEAYDISRLLFAIKRPFSFRVKQDLMARQHPLLEPLTIRDRPNHTTFRFWQEGPGHDRNLFSREKMLAAAEYIHHNPVRRGLVETVDLWRWSSWKYYHPPWTYDDPALPTRHGFPE